MDKSVVQLNMFVACEQTHSWGLTDESVRRLVKQEAFTDVSGLSLSFEADNYKKW